MLDKASAKIMPGMTLDVIVGDYTVPIAWADQKENANNETLALYRKSLGRVTAK